MPGVEEQDSNPIEGIIDAGEQSRGPRPITESEDLEAQKVTADVGASADHQVDSNTWRIEENPRRNCMGRTNRGVGIVVALTIFGLGMYALVLWLLIPSFKYISDARERQQWKPVLAKVTAVDRATCIVEYEYVVDSITYRARKDASGQNLSCAKLTPKSNLGVWYDVKQPAESSFLPRDSIEFNDLSLCAVTAYSFMFVATGAALFGYFIRRKPAFYALCVLHPLLALIANAPTSIIRLTRNHSSAWLLLVLALLSGITLAFCIFKLTSKSACCTTSLSTNAMSCSQTAHETQACNP